ncbi:MAG: hypothetical protein IBX72_09055 [Nitrospirae bacterium]|jgi:hypothetical protein|nr:hypothetical protein [Nitrospirota bacterium]
MENMISLFQDHLFAGIAIIILLLLSFYRKPKLFLAVFLLVVILSSTLYLILNISSIGATYKKELVQKSITDSF